MFLNKLFSRKKTQNPPAETTNAERPKQGALPSTSLAPIITDETDRPEGLVVACSDLQQYVASLLDCEELSYREGVRCFPVLCGPSGPPQVLLFPGCSPAVVPYSTSASFEPLKGLEWQDYRDILLERCQSTESRDHSVCLIDPEDPACLHGLAHALSSGKCIECLQSLDAVEFRSLVASNRFHSLTFVCSPKLLAECSLDSLVKELTESYRDKASVSGRLRWGILTARDLPHLSALIAKLHFSEAPLEASARVFLGDDSSIEYGSDPSFDVIRCPKIEAYALEELYEEPTPLTIFYGHGLHFCFSEGLLCSADPKGSSMPRKCIEGYECVFMHADEDRAILTTQRMTSSVVVLNSCFSGSFKAAKHAGLNLVTSLLKAVPSSVIAPYRSNRIHPMLGFMAWDFLRQGMTIGDTAAELNAAVSNQGSRVEPLVLFGDPDLTPFKRSANYPIELVGDRRSSDSVHFDLPAKASCVESFVTEDAWLVGQLENGKDLHCLLDESNAAHALIQTRPSLDPGRVHFIAHWLNRAPLRGELTLTTRPIIVETMIQTAQDVLQGCEETLGAQVGALSTEMVPSCEPQSPPPPGASLHELLSTLEPHLSRTLGQTTQSPLLYGALNSRSTEILDEIAETNRKLLHAACSEHSKLLPVETFGESQGVRFGDANFVELPCSRCGSRVTRRRYYVGLRSERWLFECEACDFLCDVRAGMPMLLLEGPDRLQRSKVAEFRLSGKSPGSASVLHARVVGRAIGRAAGHDTQLFAILPECVEASLSPGEDFGLTFEVEPVGSILPFCYRLKASVCINGKFGVAFRRVEISN